MKHLHIFTILSLVTISNISFAQTKKIMHRSHSGSNASFSSYESEDNFGIAPRDYERDLRRDSIYAAQKKKDSIDAAKSKQHKDSAVKKNTPKTNVPKKTGVKYEDSKK